MKKKEKAFSPVADVIRTIIPEERFEEAAALKTLSGAWLAVVGDGRLAGESRPLKIDRAVLTIGVDHPVWTVELNSRRREILENVVRLIPRRGVREIKVILSASRRTP